MGVLYQDSSHVVFPDCSMGKEGEDEYESMVADEARVRAMVDIFQAVRMKREEDS